MADIIDFTTGKLAEPHTLVLFDYQNGEYFTEVFRSRTEAEFKAESVDMEIFKAEIWSGQPPAGFCEWFGSRNHPFHTYERYQPEAVIDGYPPFNQ